ncbi:MAG: hypothetical protein A2017_05700 [Lentisphaerae bacterium GWF2_44_16]|nr:MAG: hypothetical protein A2017_05700 [Lentisphaerae bacterium GWF2_44_16]
MKFIKFPHSAVLTSLVLLLSVPESLAEDALKREDKDKVYFFQMAHEKAPFFQDAIHITQNTLYNDKTGYGWLHKGTRGEVGESLVARLYKPNSPPVPDSVAGYCVFWRGGKDPLTFRTDLPDGEYKIWVYSGMFCFNRFYDIIPFVISAGAKEKIKNTDTLKTFRKRFFEEFDDSYEYTPKWTVETIWEKYVKKQSAFLYSLTGKAENGHLDIQFFMPLSEKNDGAKSNAVLPINAIIICSLAKFEDGEKEIAKIETERRRQFIKQTKLSVFKDKKLMPEIADEFKTSGYVPFVRDFMKPILPGSVPLKSEISKNLNMFMAQGQREILSFAIHPLKDMKNVRVEAGELKDANGNTLKKDAVKLQWIRYMLQPLDYMRRTPEYRGVPLLMMDYKPLDYMNGMNRQYILSVTAPENAAPGTYKGTITISPEAGKPMALNLEVKIYPFKLETYADDDERVWLYYADNTYKIYGELLFNNEERWQRIEKDLAFMKQQLIAPTILFDYNASDEDLDKFMALYKKYSFRGYGVFGDYKMLGLLENYCKGKSKDKDLSPFIKKIKEVLARKKEKGWPDIAFYTFAEIHTGMPGYLLGKEMIAQIKKEVPEAVLITLPNMIQEADVMVTTEADIVGPNAVSMTESVVEKIHKAKKKLWFYGWGRQRFRCGLVDWRLGNRGAIKEWYNYTARAPFNPLDGSSFDCWNDAPPFIGPNGPISTLGMEEATQGRLDFFYLATLEKWIEKANALKTPFSRKASAYGQAIIDDLKERIMPDYLYYYQRLKATDMKTNQFDVNKEQVFKWKEDEYNIYRRKIADAIAVLKDACEGRDSVPVAEKKYAEKQIVSGKSEAFTTNSSGALRLTDDDFIDSNPVWSPDGNTVSYISKRKGGEKIVLINLNNKTEKILPSVTAKNSYYSWSPQSDKIAYTAKDNKVSVISLKDDNVFVVGRGQNPVFSPDGKLLAYLSGKDLMVCDTATGKILNLSKQQAEGSMEKLSWSTDGRSIYYSKDGDLWEASADGSKNECVLNHNAMGYSVAPSIESPLASPDGKKIFMTLNSDGLFAHVSNNQLAVYDLVSRKVKIINDANSWTLSPDGSKIVYNIKSNLMTYDVASGKKSKFIQGSEPAFSPKGNRIVYLYRKSMLQEPDVWVTTVP